MQIGNSKGIYSALSNIYKRQIGFTYAWLLFFVVISSTALSITGQIWSQTHQREKEKELIWIGNQFIKAIGSYYQYTPGTIKKYPSKLEDLLEDHRRANIARHLRKLYIDPMTRNTEWGIIEAPEGGIIGVYSHSSRLPIRQYNFTEPNNQNLATHYSDWKFIYTPPAPTKTPVPGQSF